MYGLVAPATRKKRNLNGDLVEFFRRPGRAPASAILLDSGASIVRLASLGLVLGYKKIVFVGVDLNHSRYFWEENPLYLKKLGLASFASSQVRGVHETMIPVGRPFIVADMLFYLAQAARQLFEAQFFVASESSALSKFLPVFSPLKPE